jgi:hypothetical protein
MEWYKNNYYLIHDYYFLVVSDIFNVISQELKEETFTFKFKLTTFNKCLETGMLIDIKFDKTTIIYRRPTFFNTFWLLQFLEDNN